MKFGLFSDGKKTIKHQNKNLYKENLNNWYFEVFTPQPHPSIQFKFINIAQCIQNPDQRKNTITGISNIMSLIVPGE